MTLTFCVSFPYPLNFLFHLAEGPGEKGIRRSIYTVLHCWYLCNLDVAKVKHWPIHSWDTSAYYLEIIQIIEWYCNFPTKTSHLQQSPSALWASENTPISHVPFFSSLKFISCLQRNSLHTRWVIDGNVVYSHSSLTPGRASSIITSYSLTCRYMG